MLQIKKIFNRYKYYILVIILLLLIVFILLFNSFNSEKIDKVEAIKEIKTEEKVEKPKKAYIKVDVKGEVQKPGVYELEEGKRVIDSINMSGGLTKNADTSYLNLSKRLKDEMTIIVYSKEEIANMKDQESMIVYMEKECNCPSISNDACINDNSNSDSINNSNEKININSATIEELQSLTGIGESKAKSIVEYRETNGNFKNIEDIMNVSGIGESAYSKIKDNITV